MSLCQILEVWEHVEWLANKLGDVGNGNHSHWLVTVLDSKFCLGTHEGFIPYGQSTLAYDIEITDVTDKVIAFPQSWLVGFIFILF